MNKRLLFRVRKLPSRRAISTREHSLPVHGESFRNYETHRLVSTILITLPLLICVSYLSCCWSSRFGIFLVVPTHISFIFLRSTFVATVRVSRMDSILLVVVRFYFVTGVNCHEKELREPFLVIQSTLYAKLGVMHSMHTNALTQYARRVCRRSACYCKHIFKHYQMSYPSRGLSVVIMMA